MHVHDLNPWRTLIVLSAFIIILIIGFLTMSKPLISYKLDMNKSLEELNKEDAFFNPWQLDGFIKNETQNVMLFDIRDNFIFGQGHIPGAENISANDFTKEESIERLEKLGEMGVTVVLYGDNQLQANGPWMLFRQVGFNNVKVLLGGYQYYIEHKDNLYATKEDKSFQKSIPRFNYAVMAAPKNGTVSTAAEKKPVVVQRKQKTGATAGGC